MDASVTPLLSPVTWMSLWGFTVQYALRKAFVGNMYGFIDRWEE